MYLFICLIFLIEAGNVSAKSCSDLCAEEGAACKAYYNNPKIPFIAECGYPIDDSSVDIVGICDVNSSLSVSFCICY